MYQGYEHELARGRAARPDGTSAIPEGRVARGFALVAGLFDAHSVS